jgi:hypothetical protein
MSYCEIIAFKDGKPGECLECRNSWLGAAFIWNCIWDKWLKNPAKEYDTWIVPGPNTQKLWDAVKRSDIPVAIRAVHASTFDHAVIYQKDFARFAADLGEFVRYFDAVGKSHLESWAEFVRTHNDADAVGFYQNSVVDHPWYQQGTDDSIPYDLNTGDKHFDVYEHLTEIDAEATSQALGP